MYASSANLRAFACLGNPFCSLACPFNTQSVIRFLAAKSCSWRADNNVDDGCEVKGRIGKRGANKRTEDKRKTEYLVFNSRNANGVVSLLPQPLPLLKYTAVQGGNTGTS